MNPYTGDLAALDEGAVRKGFERLPKRLQPAAKKALDGDQQATINLKAKGPLQDWARKRRKAKRRSKAAKTSRRINRNRSSA